MFTILGLVLLAVLLLVAMIWIACRMFDDILSFIFFNELFKFVGHAFVVVVTVLVETIRGSE